MDGGDRVQPFPGLVENVEPIGRQREFDRISGRRTSRQLQCQFFPTWQRTVNQRLGAQRLNQFPVQSQAAGDHIDMLGPDTDGQGSTLGAHALAVGKPDRDAGRQPRRGAAFGQRRRQQVH